MTVADAQQQRIIELDQGIALVLAGPGCGKTNILARRVYNAIISGRHDISAMLCITFTNRAARQMGQRIEDYLGTLPGNLFIGNIHRFCLRFLFTNGILDADTSILDEDDLRTFLSTEFEFTTEKQIRDFLYKKSFVYQTDHDHPEWTIRRPYSPLTTIDYSRIDRYTAYRTENHFIDFDDILLITYTTLLQQNYRDFGMTGYDWVQVDEVQDMTPLQLAIVDRVSDVRNCNRVYFGDEQQAIFRFIGAGGPALDALKTICKGNIYRMHRNYRSPAYLVNMCNNIAVKWLGLPLALLPVAIRNVNKDDNLVACKASRDILPFIAATIAESWLSTVCGDIAILVRTNEDGARVSKALDYINVPHFLVSRNDLFHSVSFKTIWAHLAVVVNPLHYSQWARLLYQTRSVKTLSGAEKLTQLLRDCAINPIQLFDIDAPGAIERFTDIMSDASGTIVVFDTETSGLDIFNDDVVEIAAVKIRGGKILDNSRFHIFIETDRQLPKVLGDGKPNPLTDIYRNAYKFPPQLGFSLFLKYIGEDTVPAGHNLDFDRAIIYNNLLRRTTLKPTRFFDVHTPGIDTLELARLLIPRSKSYTLACLLKKFDIKGTINSHCADDDTIATAALIMHLCPVARIKMHNYSLAKSNANVRKAASRFTSAYADFYKHTRHCYFSNNGNLAGAISEASDWFAGHGYTEPIQRLHYLLRLIETVVVDNLSEHGLRHQLSAHLYDLLAFSESDFFANNIIEERISVLTIHKAKGLEMENVIIADATNTFGSTDDTARLLYVAFSRARRRLAVCYSDIPSAPLHDALKHFVPLAENIVKRSMTCYRNYTVSND